MEALAGRSQVGGEEANVSSVVKSQKRFKAGVVSWDQGCADIQEEANQKGPKKDWCTR